MEDTLRFMEKEVDFGDELMRFHHRIRGDLDGLTAVEQVAEAVLDTGYDVIRSVRPNE